MNISPTLIKDFDKLTIGNYCGYLFKLLYIDKVLSIPPSPAMKLGQYFEYLATGAKLRDGTIPEPELTKKGELTEPYKKITTQANNFKLIAENLHLSISHVSFVMEYKFGEAQSKGIADIVGEIDGKQCIIDLKTTGHYDNEYDEYGWGDNKLYKKHNLLIQAVHYKLLYNRIYKNDIDFYFWVFNSQNDWENKIIKIDVSDESINKHEGRIEFVNQMINYYLETNLFIHLSNRDTCYNCPAQEICEKYTIVPQIKEIQL